MMLMELLFGTSAGILTVFVIGFMLCMGAWFTWVFLKKSAEAPPLSDPEGNASSGPRDTSGW